MYLYLYLVSVSVPLAALIALHRVGPAEVQRWIVAASAPCFDV